MGIDTATLIGRSARLKVDDLDLDSFHNEPLEADVLRCLRYMHDVEGHTMCYLRDVLVTKAHRDPDVTAFLACWSYEEHWHGEAIAKVLGPTANWRARAVSPRCAGACRNATPSDP